MGLIKLAIINNRLDLAAHAIVYTAVKLDLDKAAPSGGKNNGKPNKRK